MRKKKFLVITILLSIMMFLFGCGESFPELTEEEYNQTVEFAVGLLMKYSNNDQSKLTKINVKELQKQREKEARAAAEKEKKDAEKEKSQTSTAQTQPQTQTTSQPEGAQKTSSATEADSKDETVSLEESIQATLESTTSEENQDLSSEDLASAATSQPEESKEEEKKEEQESTSSNPDALVLSSDYSTEVSNNIFLSYQGYSISSTYPESSKSYVINADKGKKLLVLRFDLYNAAESAQKVNMIDKGILVQTILNGKNLGYNAVTFLPNDLTSYVGTIDSKAHESLVVLSEIDASDSTNIQTLGMIVNIGGKEQEFSLQ